jgi:hypothetical protein
LLCTADGGTIGDQLYVFEKTRHSKGSGSRRKSEFGLGNKGKGKVALPPTEAEAVRLGYDQAVVVCQGGLHNIQEIKGGQKGNPMTKSAAARWVGPWPHGHVIHNEAAAGRPVWTVDGQESSYAKLDASSGNYRYVHYYRHYVH